MPSMKFAMYFAQIISELFVDKAQMKIICRKGSNEN